MEVRSFGPRVSLGNLREAAKVQDFKTQDFTRSTTSLEYKTSNLKALRGRRKPLECATNTVSPSSFGGHNAMSTKHSVACLRDLKRKQIPTSPELIACKSPELDLETGLRSQEQQSVLLPARNLRKYHSNVSLGPRRKHSRTLKQYPSKLDLLDSDYLTSFPLPITESDQGEQVEESASNYEEDNAYKRFSIVEDYIPVSTESTDHPKASSVAAKVAQKSHKKLANSCEICSTTIYTVEWFRHSKVICPECYTSNNKACDQNKYKLVTKVESADKKSLFYVVGEVHHEDATLYSVLQRKLRWRWRLRGLI